MREVLAQDSLSPLFGSRRIFRGTGRNLTESFSPVFSSMVESTYTFVNPVISHP